MNIPELAAFIYEDLEARITCVRWEGDDLCISIVCDDPKEDRKRRFSIICRGVLEANITPVCFGLIHQKFDHPLLLDHVDDFGYLAFSEAPAIPEIVFARLYEAHLEVCADWREFSKYVNHFTKAGIVSLLRGGAGMIAQGPFRIISAYEKAVSNLLQTSLVHHVREKKTTATLLLFDSEYVIAQSFQSKEVA